MLESIVRFLFLALSVASIYLLVAIGLSIVFGSLKYVNMAHAALYLIGAYLALYIAYERTYAGGILEGYGEIGLGWGFTAALILTPLIAFVIGIVMERLMAKPFYERDMLDQLLVTFGILIIFQELFVIFFDARSRSFPTPAWAEGAISLPTVGTPPGMAAVSTWRVYIVLMAIFFTVFIFAFFRYTDYGLAVRAGTEDSEMTELLGIRIGRPFLLIFAIGAAYAGLAGILDASLFNIHPHAGMDMIIPALVIVIMGGVGSIKGTVVAALLAGVAFAIANGIQPDMVRASIYILAIVILTIRPNGIYPTTGIGQ